MQRSRLITLPVLAIMVCSCATIDKQASEHEWIRKTRDATVKTANIVTGKTRETAKRMQGYMARQDLLKTFTDATEHSEAAVLAVLRKAGVGTTSSVAPPGTKPTVNNPPKPDKSPVAGTIQPPATVPAQYAGTFRWPVDAGIISSEYGKRKSGVHKGIDIAGDVGEPVFAIANGEVIYASDGMSGYGNVVIVRHDQNLTSLYAHNSELKVHQGDQVKQGFQIALLGNTGHSTGPHVHFEIRDGATPIDPRGRLPESKLASIPELHADGDKPARVAYHSSR